jgi:hypothetical protein
MFTGRSRLQNRLIVAGGQSLQRLLLAFLVLFVVLFISDWD